MGWGLHFGMGAEDAQYFCCNLVIAATTRASANGAWATLLPTAQIGNAFSGVIQRSVAGNAMETIDTSERGTSGRCW
jgi:hypothetical protein